ncbi:unnamed protein product [Symbiodinium sp. CCMP2456]|nr:unnamed protein product [Symbiodinium sp. CCMP2456]
MAGRAERQQRCREEATGQDRYTVVVGSGEESTRLEISVDSGSNVAVLRQVIAESLEELDSTKYYNLSNDPGRVQVAVQPAMWLSSFTVIAREHRHMVQAAICKDGCSDLIQNDRNLLATFNQLSKRIVHDTLDEQWIQTPEFFDVLCFVEALRTGYNPMPEVTRGSREPGEQGVPLEEILEEVDRAMKEPGATLRTVCEALWSEYE